MMLVPLDARISRATMHRLREPYRAVATTPEFASISRSEQWERLRERTRRVSGSISVAALAALDALNLGLKSQVLEWLEDERYAAQRKTGA